MKRKKLSGMIAVGCLCLFTGGFPVRGGIERILYGAMPSGKRGTLQRVVSEPVPGGRSIGDGKDRKH